MMRKRLKTLAFAMLTALGLPALPALGAGTTPLSLVQQFDSSGQPLAGCLLYFFQAGTVATPQNAFADFGLTTPLPNPLQCDASGRVPQHWLADGLIHIRLTDSSGVVQIDTTMQVLGPSSGGGGGGGTVDPTTILQTGDEKIRYGTGPLAGFVRENGLTIGNATSGATERANADTQNLFVYLYQTDPNLSVSGGRTGNALNDYNSGKTIALPDMRGRIDAFLDDMGNSAAGRLTSTFFGSGATTLGAAGGSQQAQLATANLPPYTPSGSIANGSISVSSSDGITSSTCSGGSGGCSVGIGGGGAFGFRIGPSFGVSQGASTFAGSAQGGTSAPFAILPPMMLKTVYIKL